MLSSLHANSDTFDTVTKNEMAHIPLVKLY